MLDIWYRTTQITREDTHCCLYMGYSFRLAASFFICTIPDRIAHTTAFVTPVVEHWLERKTAIWAPPWRIDPMTHRTMRKCSYHRATSHSPYMIKCMYFWVIEGWRKKGNVLFNDALSTFYLRFYDVEHNYSDSKRGYPLLPIQGLLFLISMWFLLARTVDTMDFTLYFLIARTVDTMDFTLYFLIARTIDTMDFTLYFLIARTIDTIVFTLYFLIARTIDTMDFTLYFLKARTVDTMDFTLYFLIARTVDTMDFTLYFLIARTVDTMDFTLYFLKARTVDTMDFTLYFLIARTVDTMDFTLCLLIARTVD